MHPKAYLYRRIVQAKLYIDEHFAEKIQLNDTSAEAYFSKYHFIRLFKSAYGCTPHQYVTKVRIDHAKILLTQGKSVSEACELSGFESLGSFSSLFRRQVKLSPNEYKRQQMTRQKLQKEKPLSFIPNCFAEAKGWV